MDAGDGPDRFEDLRELSALCRAGKLFAVQEWIDSGRRYYSLEQRQTGPWQPPFETAIDTGFHSLIEVFLQAGMPQDRRNDALWTVVYRKKIDLAYLLLSYGADPAALTAEDVFDSRSPDLIRWMIDHGMDLEAGWPIARAFENKQREFLGIYLDLRDRIPSARKQAAMALRAHSAEGNLKWVCLLLWAEADPRLPVPMRDEDDPGNETEDDVGTALEDAVTHGHIEVAKKFKISARDPLDRFLCEHMTAFNPNAIEVLLKLGANPNSRVDRKTAIENAVGNLASYLERDWSEGRENALASICLLARSGARWRPRDPHEYYWLRRGLSRAESYSAVKSLKRMADVNAFELDVFMELMKTAPMKALLQDEFDSDAEALRKYAGIAFKQPQGRQKRARARRRSRALLAPSS